MPARRRAALGRGGKDRHQVGAIEAPAPPLQGRLDRFSGERSSNELDLSLVAGDSFASETEGLDLEDDRNRLLSATSAPAPAPRFGLGFGGRPRPMILPISIHRVRS
jgi:hypothetical protein